MGRYLDLIRGLDDETEGKRSATTITTITTKVELRSYKSFLSYSKMCPPDGILSATGSQSRSATPLPSSLVADHTTKTTVTTKVTPADAEDEATDGSLAVATTWAESLKRLNLDWPPADMPLRRWHSFIADVGKFLEDGWADRATALGWGAHDLFGCDRNRPFARLDQAGLLWHLNRDRVIALTTETAVIERHTGTRQTWRRKAVEANQVLVWELVPACAAVR
jgi:hypothetical protein